MKIFPKYDGFFALTLHDFFGLPVFSESDTDAHLYWAMANDRNPIHFDFVVLGDLVKLNQRTLRRISFIDQKMIVKIKEGLSSLGLHLRMIHECGPKERRSKSEHSELIIECSLEEL
jgi:hypothetical protein